MPDIRIAYIDGGDIYQPFVEAALKSQYTIVRVKSPADEPDLVVCSVFGNEHIGYNRFKKLCISGENNFPDFHHYDYYVSCHGIEYPRHLRIPFFVFRGQYPFVLSRDVTRNITYDSFLKRRSEFVNRKFCSAVISNVTCSDPRRVELFNCINNYKKVDSAGKALNNVGRLEDLIKDPPKNVLDLYNFTKHCFIKEYKFNIAFENSVVEGYITEKIVDAFAATTVPIYFGTEDVKNIFNPDSFIYANDYDTTDALIARIEELDSNDDLYMDMLLAPKFVNHSYCDQRDYLEKFKDFVCRVVSSGTIFERQYGWMHHMK